MVCLLFFLKSDSLKLGSFARCETGRSSIKSNRVYNRNNSPKQKVSAGSYLERLDYARMSLSCHLKWLRLEQIYTNSLQAIYSFTTLAVPLPGLFGLLNLFELSSFGGWMYLTKNSCDKSATSEISKLVSILRVPEAVAVDRT